MTSAPGASARTDATIATAIFGVTLAMVAWGVAGRAVYNGDDAIYAGFVREMLDGGGWLELRFDGQVVHQRPPLYVWLCALSGSIFGLSEDALRAPALLATAGTAVLVFLLGRRLVGRPAAVLGGLLYGTLALPFIYARAITSDAVLVFFCLLAVHAWRELDRPRAPLWLGVALGAALMTKQIIGALPLLAVAVTAVARPRSEWPAPRRVLIAAGVALLVWAPWHLVMLVRHGGDFLDGYVGYNVVARTSESVLAPTRPSYYLGILWSKEGVLALLALAGAVFVAVRAFLRRESREDDLLLLAWPLAVLIPFSAASTRIDYYLLPAYPMLALLCVAPIEAATQRARRDVAYVALAVAAAVVATSFALHVPRRAHAMDPFAELRDLARAAAASPPGTPLFVLDELYLAPRFYSGQPTFMLVSDREVFERYRRMEPLRSATTVEFLSPEQIGDRLLRTPRWLALTDRRRAGPLPSSVRIIAEGERYVLFGAGP